MSAQNSPSATCPTCGGTGADLWTRDENGWWEADCGNEWHDQFDRLAKPTREGLLGMVRLEADEHG